jgi:hypothetical protein
METLNESFRLVSRPVAFGLAVLATSLLFTSTTFILTSGAQAYGTAATQVAQAAPASQHQV